MKRLPFVLAAVCLAVVGCDVKVDRTGAITLAGSANIPLIDKSGTHAELVAGSAEFIVQKGSKDKTIAVTVKQINRPDVNFEAPVLGDYRSGNFTLRGNEIGQPVDLASARSYAITGPNQRYTTWEDHGFETCLVEYSWDPCDENWTIGFSNAAGPLGTFAARTATRCNERQDQFACHPNQREPRYPDIPRDPRPHRLEKILSVDPSKVQFD